MCSQSHLTEHFLWIQSSASEVTSHLSSLLTKYDAVLKVTEPQHLWWRVELQNHRNDGYGCPIIRPKENVPHFSKLLKMTQDLKSVWPTMSIYWSKLFQIVVGRLLSVYFDLSVSEYKDDPHSLLWQKLTYSPMWPCSNFSTQQVTSLQIGDIGKSQTREGTTGHAGSWRGPHPDWAEIYQAIPSFTGVVLFQSTFG